MLRFKQINKENFEQVVTLQKEAFPGQDIVPHLQVSINKTYFDKYSQTIKKYWIAYNNKTPVGMIGIHAYKIYPEEAWIDWFGVYSKFRQKGYGTEIFNFLESYAKSKGFIKFF